MARKVYVSSDMAHDERLIEVAAESPEAALLWPWILTHFDDWGRAEAHPKRIKAQLFPHNSLVRTELITQSLILYDKVDLIMLYVVDECDFMVHLDHFRTFHRMARPSKIPDPPVSGSRAQKVAEYLRQCAEWPQYPDSPWLRHRRAVFRRDGYRCVYCGATDRLTIDHVVPRSRSGSDDPENLVTACWTCNRKKADREPHEAGMDILKVGGRDV